MCHSISRGNCPLDLAARNLGKLSHARWLTKFDIKREPSCSDGGRHVFRVIQLSRYLNNELKAVIDPVIKRNAYFCHPENLLLAKLSDDRPALRQLGLRRILKARTKRSTDIREFVIPELYFDASGYYELIDWQNFLVSAPALLSTVTDGDIRGFINDTRTCPVDLL
ncbi:unnamed protein product [Psylliodes chrysocephalus]|uniref:Uncharacterized protein n=1 Tax=Psylliodes chrysocephalus TaxID=3402493 RepID=A0A9P0DA46_9CUCU|nr:unnamed protein product [Psylliodes chrysocephala]